MDDPGRADATDSTSDGIPRAIFPVIKIAAGFALLFMTVISACSSDGEPEVSGPPPLPDPTFIYSSDGVLETTLTAQPGTVSFNGKTYSTNLYNGQYIPPVWRLSPGDTIDLELVNETSEPSPSPDAESHGAAHQDQSFTNLHYHGFNVSPQAPADDIFLSIFPQDSGKTPTSYQYDVPVPESHPVGLFWFHPHPHGQSEAQVLGGMSGGMIVGDILQEYYPGVADARERVMLLKDFQTNPNDPLLKTINGVPQASNGGPPQASISMAPDEPEFWRFANIGADAFFDMQLQDLDGNVVPMYVIAVDGNPTDEPITMNDLFLGAGARMEALVVCPSAGSYVLKSLEVPTGPQGDQNPEVVLAEVTCSGSPSDPMQPEEVADLRPAQTDPGLSALLQRRKGDTVPTERSFVFAEDDHGNTFYINGNTYEVDRVDTTTQAGAWEEWTITNTSGELHVFHIHQLDYLVEEINGFAQPVHGLQDTITLPYAQGGQPGEVKILIHFPPTAVGEFVYHCHILGHEDNGMMANIVVEQ